MRKGSRLDNGVGRPGVQLPLPSSVKLRMGSNSVRAVLCGPLVNCGESSLNLQPLQSEVGPELMQGYRVSVRNAWLLEHFSESMYNLEDLPVLWAGPLPLTQWANYSLDGRMVISFPQGKP